MEKKVVLAMVNGALCIDPSDISRVNLDVLSATLKNKYGYDVPINIAPISTWMPDCGTEAVMDLAAREMTECAIKSIGEQKSVITRNYCNNRHMRRAMAKAERLKK